MKCFCINGAFKTFIIDFCREQASSASGKAASGMSSDERNQVCCLALIWMLHC